MTPISGISRCSTSSERPRFLPDEPRETPGVRGAFLMPFFGRYQVAAEIVQALRS